MTFNPQAFEFYPALVHWLIVFGSCLGIALVVALVTVLAIGGKYGLTNLAEQIGSGISDTVHTSSRRVWALTMLTFREANRRKALYVFIIFALVFMFAGWFITDVTDRPEHEVKVNVSFVLTAISWLILPVALLLACWGLPEDIRARSLHTVVTKPARRNEVVLGRMLGFTLVSTLVLVIMGAVGYVWIQRQVSGPARERLICRVPVYGTLSYTDRYGNPAEKGLNVGDIWEFRGYIEGATRAAAIWQFEGVTPDDLIDGRLRLESRFEAFRTHKGQMGETLLVQFEFVNPDTELRVPIPAFHVADFGENVVFVDPQLDYTAGSDAERKTAQLFGDIIRDGKLRVDVKCLDAGQYLGMARPDLFIRTPDRPFFVGYVKAIGGIWLMLVLVIVLGVTASCFVKGPVATLLTFTLVIVGAGFREFMARIVGGDWVGGGPIESVIRIVLHLNPQVQLRQTLATDIVQFIDQIIIHGLWLVQQIIPNFEHYRMWPYVANGFDVSWSTALLPSIGVTLAYIVPCLLIGHYSLKLRELEAK